MNKTILLVIAFVVGFLSLSGQSDDPYAAVLDIRKQGVYSHYADSYVANILTGRRILRFQESIQAIFSGQVYRTGIFNI